MVLVMENIGSPSDWVQYSYNIWWCSLCTDATGINSFKTPSPNQSTGAQDGRQLVVLKVTSMIEQEICSMNTTNGQVGL